MKSMLPPVVTISVYNFLLGSGVGLGFGPPGSAAVQ